MAETGDFDWAVPVMRLGYAGRSLVYVVVASFSLWSILHGGEGEGTSSALAALENSVGGNFVLLAIFLGMACYAVWRLIDAYWDLECYGTDGEGMIARLGMTVTGIIHLAIGVGALLLVFTSSGGGGESSISKAVEAILGWPGGRWILLAAGLITLGSGAYYGKKAVKRDYREHLRGNHFTRNWDPLLRAGVGAQGFIVGVIGVFIAYAAWTYSPENAGGLGSVFSWLSDQAYGQALVLALCAGLLCFALFCGVNAVFRIVPRATDPDIETLASRMKAKAKAKAA